MASGGTLVSNEMSPSWTEHKDGQGPYVEGRPWCCPLLAGRGGLVGLSGSLCRGAVTSEFSILLLTIPIIILHTSMLKSPTCSLPRFSWVWNKKHTVILPQKKTIKTAAHCQVVAVKLRAFYGKLLTFIPTNWLSHPFTSLRLPTSRCSLSLPLRLANLIYQHLSFIERRCSFSDTSLSDKRHADAATESIRRVGET